MAALDPTGVIPFCIIGVADGVPLPAGVSSHRERRLLAGVGVSDGAPSPPRSVRGVSAHPLPWPGVSTEQNGKYRVNFSTTKYEYLSLKSFLI